MKAPQLFIASLLLISCMATSAQTCAALQIKKGTQYITLRQVNMVQTKDAAYYKANAKTRKAIDDAWQGMVRSGSLQPMTDTVKVAITDVQSTGTATNYSATVFSKGVGYDVYYTCNDNKLYMYPFKKVTVTETETADHKKAYLTTYSGTNIIPLNLKVGDTLPDYQNYSISSPLTEHWTQEWKSEYTDAMGTDWIVTHYEDKHVTVSSSTITKFCNREVLAQEDYQFNGVTYKAFKILTEIWVKHDVDVKSNSWIASLVGRAATKAVDRKMSKFIAKNQEGYTVSYQIDWFVPELGLGRSEMYNSDGELIAKMTTVGSR